MSAVAGSGTAGLVAGVAAGASSCTECRSVGLLERSERVSELANLLRSLCSSYCTHATHTVVLRLPLPPHPGAPPGGVSVLLRLSRRMPVALVAGHSAGGSRLPHPFLEELPERWDVRYEGLALQGPALNSLPASMKEVLDTACFGAGTLEFWKALGGKVEYESYREGNEYNIVFHGHEIKVTLAHVYALLEPHVLRDPSSLKRIGGALTVEAALLVPEGRHYEGANLLGVFGAQLAPYVKLVRAEVPLGSAAAAAQHQQQQQVAAGRRK